MKAKRKNAAGRGSLRKAKKAIKGRGKGRLSRGDWREIAGILGRDAGPGVRRKANAGKDVVFYDVMDGNYAISRSHYHKSDASKRMREIARDDRRAGTPRKLKVVKRILKANPAGVRMKAVGKGTGWISAKRVKIVRRGRRTDVLIERAPRKRRK